jgi:hypothetical protein
VKGEREKGEVQALSRSTVRSEQSSFSSVVQPSSAASPTESESAEYDEQYNDQDDPTGCAHDASFCRE